MNTKFFSFDNTQNSQVSKLCILIFWRNQPNL